jgi:hypothetical protein
MKNNKNNTEPCNYTNTMLGAVSESVLNNEISPKNWSIYKTDVLNSLTQELKMSYWETNDKFPIR